ncbi:MAG: CDP-alcohol phosphatidyltransferase family protein [Clostridia bacterium]|nr:CDP-alcohol phosphatidyltransferase family protein [Clostridia bacterium]
MKELFKGCWTIPNLISFIRILLVPLFAYLFLQGDFVPAVIVLALSGLSDCVDGKIARKFNQISALGKMLDPLADKLTQITLAVLLFITFNKAEDTMLNAFSWVFLVFIVKEFIMVLGSVIMLNIGLRPGAAEIYGKVATLAFYVVMVFIIGFGPEVGAFRNLFTIPNTLMMILVIISAILTLVAFFSYIPDVIRQVKEKKANKSR